MTDVDQELDWLIFLSQSMFPKIDGNCNGLLTGYNQEVWNEITFPNPAKSQQSVVQIKLLYACTPTSTKTGSYLLLIIILGGLLTLLWHRSHATSTAKAWGERCTCTYKLKYTSNQSHVLKKYCKVSYNACLDVTFKYNMVWGWTVLISSQWGATQHVILTVHQK